MKKALLLALSFVLISMVGFTQTGNYWSAHNDMGGKITTDKAVARQSFPKSFKLFDLNITSLSQNLFSIVGQQSSRHSSTTISLPNADGQMEQFEVFEASNFEPALQARFPEIRAYSGKGITDKSAMLKLSISPQGIQTMIFRTEGENEYVEPYSQNHTVYAVFKSQRNKGGLPWTCSTVDQNLATSLNGQVANQQRPESDAGQLKTMRLAQSCNGEYSNFFGATSAAQVALVLAAYNATLTRCNGCYEKDLALHLNLIANTADVIYYNPATDPYTTLAAWNGQLQATLNAIIGAANYDIGHMFGASGGGGNAGCIGCVCNDANKGSGITSPADGIPQGDNFDIDYVAHEVGHQLGGNHTFSQSLEGTGVNKEVGSGITIMGYAGITFQDVAPHSIDIFHEASIQQIQTNLATKTCPITTNITANNATPVVLALTARVIPFSTPFSLTGSATDANASDVLTYCWEQNDNSTTTGVNSVASPTKLTGPNWLTFSPTTSPTRSFPRLSTILAGNLVTGPLPGGDAGANIEAVSSVGRVLNFRLTVRDNSPYVSSGAIKVGQTAFTDVAITVDATSGPFQVTSPNTNVSYQGGSLQTITWDVNNTNAAPISCTNVKISFSNDGGLTFPTVLSASTANDGSEALTIPVGLTTIARVKVEAIGNIFFDISNTNFTVTAPAFDFSFGTTTATTAACPTPATLTLNIPTNSVGGFTNGITLAATTGVPVGTTVTFAPNPVTPGNVAVATLNNAVSLAAGTYNITVTGTAAAASVKTTVISFVITAGSPPIITTNINSVSLCAPDVTTFTAAATGIGLTYQWQSAPTGSTTFTNIPTATTATYTIPTSTVATSGNQYRLSILSTCLPATPTLSNIAVVTVKDRVALTLQPVAFSGCTGVNYTFTANAAAAGNTITYQWQSSNTGAPGSFVNILGATATSTATANASYVINSATINLNGSFYRVYFTVPCGSSTSADTSVAVKLLLSVKPTIVLTAPLTSNTNAAVNQGIFTTISPANFAGTYTWTRNNTVIPNTLASSFILLPVDGIGKYQVSTKDGITGCLSESNILDIDIQKADNLALNQIFTFPNPVSNILYVRYNTSNLAARGTMLNIYDEKASKVFSATYSVVGTNGRMQVDMSKLKMGTYIVYIMDANGKKLASTKVVKVQ